LDDDNQSSPEGRVSESLNAAANLVKAVPIYDDAVQPLAKETGKALGTVGRCVNAALMPVRGVVWGFEQVEEWINTKVTERLRDVDPEKISEPDLSIAGPIVEALKFNGHKNELAEMFATLLATAMTEGDQKKAHPSFVSTIKDLTPVEAQILSLIAAKRWVPFADVGVRISSQKMAIVVPTFCPDILTSLEQPFDFLKQPLLAEFDNLQRLKLIQFSYGVLNNLEDTYRVIEEDPWYLDFISRNDIPASGQTVYLNKGNVCLTSFGERFVEVCRGI